MRNKFLIIGLAMSGLVACQNNQNSLIKLNETNDYHECIVMKCDSKIDKCKIIASILTPFCDKHIKMIKNNKVLDVCGDCYRHYINECKELIQK